MNSLPRFAYFPLWTLILLLSTGCEGLPYVLHVAQGQLGVQGNVEPIDAVLASGRLSDTDAAKLRLIVKAREYAANTIGLKVGRSYTMFYDSAGDALAWNLSAARQEALVAKTWSFPIVGEVPYLSFFDEGYLRLIEDQLKAQGYDTLTYELDAYSTLGVFDDPVRSTMLRRGVISLADTIIHELLHNTVWRPNATVFNESLATFVGRTGAVQFLRAEYGEDSGWPELAVEVYADTDVTNEFLMQFYNDLTAFYAQPLSVEEKIAGREAVYEAARERFVNEVMPTLNHPEAFAHNADLPTNNAWVLSNYRYNLDLEVFEAVYAATGSDWAAALEVFGAAAASSGDPFAYLRAWVAEHGG